MVVSYLLILFFFFQAEDGIRDLTVTGVQTCALPISQLVKHGPGACPVGRVPAAEIEIAVVDHLRGLLRAPEIVVGTWRAARPRIEGIAEEEVREALERLDPLWNELFPHEQARIVHLLVERVVVGTDGVGIRLRTEGLANL